MTLDLYLSQLVEFNLAIYYTTYLIQKLLIMSGLRVIGWPHFCDANVTIR